MKASQARRVCDSTDPSSVFPEISVGCWAFRLKYIQRTCEGQEREKSIMCKIAPYVGECLLLPDINRLCVSLAIQHAESWKRCVKSCFLLLLSALIRLHFGRSIPARCHILCQESRMIVFWVSNTRQSKITNLLCRTCVCVWCECNEREWETTEKDQINHHYNVRMSTLLLCLEEIYLPLDHM